MLSACSSRLHVLPQTPGDNTESSGYASPEDLAQQARKKEAEDKWWSTKPEAETGATAGVGGGGTSWWDEDSDGGSGGARDSTGIEPDALPSFFDE